MSWLNPHLRTLAALAVFCVASPSFAQLIVDSPTQDAMNLKLIFENAQHTVQMSAQLRQLQMLASNAQETIQVARKVYDGINDFRSFDPQQFYASAQNFFLSRVPLAADVQGFARDIANSQQAPYEALSLKHSRDLYGDAAMRQSSVQHYGLAFDFEAALSISRDLERLVQNPLFQQQTLNTPQPETASEGILNYNAARADPQLLTLLARQRAEAQDTAQLAMKMYMESLGASPGKAQQLAAQATTRTALELARINDKEAKLLTLEETRQAEESGTTALARREREALWGAITEQLNRDAANTAAAGDAPPPAFHVTDL